MKSIFDIIDMKNIFTIYYIETIQSTISSVKNIK